MHSYALVPSRLECVLAMIDYGIQVTAVMRKGNIWGSQFHPQKFACRLSVIAHFHFGALMRRCALFRRRCGSGGGEYFSFHRINHCWGQICARGSRRTGSKSLFDRYLIINYQKSAKVSYRRNALGLFVSVLIFSSAPNKSKLHGKRSNPYC